MEVYGSGKVATVPQYIENQKREQSRWMGSIAQDGAGNMIVGYTASGTNELTGLT